MNDLPNRDVVIFTEALELQADEGAAYVERACAGDPKLRQKVEALLHTHSMSEIFWRNRRKKPRLKPEWEVQLAKSLGIELAATNCCNRLARVVGGWSLWLSRWSRFAGWSPSK